MLTRGGDSILIMFDVSLLSCKISPLHIQLSLRVTTARQLETRIGKALLLINCLKTVQAELYWATLANVHLYMFYTKFLFFFLLFFMLVCTLYIWFLGDVIAWIGCDVIRLYSSSIKLETFLRTSHVYSFSFQPVVVRHVNRKLMEHAFTSGKVLDFLSLFSSMETQCTFFPL